MPTKFRILGLASLLGLLTLFLGNIKLSKFRSVFGVLGDASLREAAGGTGIFIGAAINYNYVSLDSSHHDDTYASVAAREFNLLTAENGCKMNSIARGFDTEKELDFTKCDAVLEFAQKNGMVMRGHNLIWSNPGQGGNHNPKFVNEEKDGAKLEKFMLDYIGKVVGHYKDVQEKRPMGKPLVAWDVVNEAVVVGKSIIHKEDTPWGLFDDYVCKAFHAAKKAAHPDTLMFYNDYGHASMVGSMKAKSDAVFSYLNSLRERGCPVEGVGFQLHVTMDMTDEELEGIRANLRRYKKIGINHIHFTEIDVKCSTNCPNPWPTSYLDKQAHVYRKLVEICLQEDNCESFETWGVTDKYSWLAKNQNGLMFNEGYGKKPAYWTVLDALKYYKVKQTQPPQNQDLSSSETVHYLVS
jgi:endo-1,4-beta-xylanase